MFINGVNLNKKLIFITFKYTMYLSSRYPHLLRCLIDYQLSYLVSEEKSHCTAERPINIVALYNPIGAPKRTKGTSHDKSQYRIPTPCHK